MAGRSQPVGVLQWKLGNKHLRCSVLCVPPPAGAPHWPNPRGSQSRKELADAVSTTQPLGGTGWVERAGEWMGGVAVQILNGT